MAGRDDTQTRLDAGEAEDTIGYKLRLAQILAFRGFEQRLTDHGRAPRYLGLLSVIRAHPGKPQSRIAEAVALPRSSFVTILDQLSADGLIERRPSTFDRRVNGIWLTPEGETVVAGLMQEAQRYEAEMTRGMSAEDIACGLRVLQKLIDNLS
ncbi:MarR family winged helix-turn-helix transcriptional regulator [Salipiger mangrovisoli]|uniref:MarR family transcriptional regulator n=1 Tax=Salipiger mangrovisoli TaxID=2865933 RepID=A0ABR9XAG7_9RHOB|nr:MarR family transcriptional regulator [Salipiger mangrovisoli]MBE9640508.1 MarR family transcriptional regulator [Salipiger mangrovisoli]